MKLQWFDPERIKPKPRQEVHTINGIPSTDERSMSRENLFAYCERERLVPCPHCLEKGIVLARFCEHAKGAA
jgi:hypothetical protein